LAFGLWPLACHVCSVPRWLVGLLAVTAMLPSVSGLLPCWPLRRIAISVPSPLSLPACGASYRCTACGVPALCVALPSHASACALPVRCFSLPLVSRRLCCSVCLYHVCIAPTGLLRWRLLSCIGIVASLQCLTSMLISQPDCWLAGWLAGFGHCVLWCHVQDMCLLRQQRATRSQIGHVSLRHQYPRTRTLPRATTTGHEYLHPVSLSIQHALTPAVLPLHPTLTHLSSLSCCCPHLLHHPC